MAAAWHGGLVGDGQFVKDPSLRTDISSAMGYWFDRDFTNPGCLDSGGTPACPCTNPDNSLWYASMLVFFESEILIPMKFATKGTRTGFPTLVLSTTQ